LGAKSKESYNRGGKIPDFRIEGVKFRFIQNRGGKTAFKPKKKVWRFS
jgi:hypothetical protein